MGDSRQTSASALAVPSPGPPHPSSLLQPAWPPDGTRSNCPLPPCGTALPDSPGPLRASALAGFLLHLSLGSLLQGALLAIPPRAEPHYSHSTHTPVLVASQTTKGKDLTGDTPTNLLSVIPSPQMSLDPVCFLSPPLKPGVSPCDLSPRLPPLLCTGPCSFSPRLPSLLCRQGGVFQCQCGFHCSPDTSH